MNLYIQPFSLVSDEIEARVYDAITSQPDCNVFDSLELLTQQYFLDYPEESRYYRHEVIESTFESKAELLTLEACSLAEPATDYEALADEYFLLSEATQLSLF